MRKGLWLPVLVVLLFLISPGIVGAEGGNWEYVLNLLNNKRSEVGKDPVSVSHPENIDMGGVLAIQQGTVEILEDYGFSGLADALNCAGYAQSTWSEGFDCKDEIEDVLNVMFIQVLPPLAPNHIDESNPYFPGGRFLSLGKGYGSYCVFVGWYHFRRALAGYYRWTEATPYLKWRTYGYWDTSSIVSYPSKLFLYWSVRGDAHVNIYLHNWGSGINLYPSDWDTSGTLLISLPAPVGQVLEGRTEINPNILNLGGLTKMSAKSIEEPIGCNFSTSYRSEISATLVFPYPTCHTETEKLLPTASFTYFPTNPIINEEITFDASSSYDPDGTIMNYEWDFGDENTAEGMQVTHAYSEAGEYTVTLTVTDNDGLYNSLSEIVNITEETEDLEPPIAYFTYSPENPFVAQKITFDASSSYDSDGTIISYEWNFGDGNTGERMWVNYAYDEGGNYTVTLTVTDNDGLKGSFSRVIEVKGVCIPVWKNTPNPNKLNVVFVPDEDYKGNLQLFRQHIQDKISLYKSVSPIKENIHSFNFYYTELEGSVENLFVPAIVREKCSFANAFAILHTRDPYPDSTDMYHHVFSAEGTNTEAFLHESGHALFELADEYEDTYYPFTHYFQPSPYPNIWNSLEGCQDDAASAGWNASECRKFCDYLPACGPSGWWKIDYDNDIMERGMSTDGFGQACKRRINYVFSSLPKIDKPSKYRKAVMAELNINNNQVTELGSKIIYGGSPNRFSEFTDFMARAFLSNGTSVEFGFWDPRIILTENGSIFRNNTNFTVILPFIKSMENIIFYNNTNDTLISINLPPMLKSFCINESISGDSDCLLGDVNGDCQVNIFDLAAVGLAFSSRPGDNNWSPEADLTGDGMVNIFDLATVGLNYGKVC